MPANWPTPSTRVATYWKAKDRAAATLAETARDAAKAICRWWRQGLQLMKIQGVLRPAATHQHREGSAGGFSKLSNRQKLRADKRRDAAPVWRRGGSVFWSPDRLVVAGSVGKGRSGRIAGIGSRQRAVRGGPDTFTLLPVSRKSAAEASAMSASSRVVFDQILPSFVPVEIEALPSR